MTSITQTSTSIVYETGDTVCFKRANSDFWKGPSTAIGCENKQVLVKHGGTYLRIHACCSEHANQSEMLSSLESTNNTEDQSTNNINKSEDTVEIFVENY